MRRLILLAALALVPIAVPPASAATLTASTVYATPAFAQSYGEHFSSPVAGDVDGDGATDVVAGFLNGHVYAWSAGGTRFLDITSPGAGGIRSTPTLVDLNGDGKLDILGSNDLGYVFAYDGAGHGLFSVRTPAYHGLQAVFASPVAADVTGDGVPEIIAAGYDHDLFVWDLAGRNKPGFPLFMADTMWASPAVADLNRDGKRDIVLTYDCDGASGSRCAGMTTTGGGFVTAINGTGAVLPGWPKFVNGQTVWSSPAVADVTGDGRPDVVVGTGLWRAAPAGTQLNAWDATGHVLPGFPVRTQGRVFGSPAIGDVTGDGKPEISVMDEKNLLYLWDGTGHVKPGWPQCNSNSRTCNGVAHASSVMADVNADGVADVVAAGQQTMRAFAGDGTVLMEAKVPSGVGQGSNAPFVTSIGGRASILYSAGRNVGGTPSGAVVHYAADSALGPAPWPSFRQSARGTGHVDDLVAPTRATLTGTLVQPTTLRVSLTASDVGTGVAAFDAWYRVDGGALVRWLTGTAPNSRSGTSATHTRNLGVQRGHTYRMQTRARDVDGNYGPWGTLDVKVP